jgi:hypothetical protein
MDTLVSASYVRLVIEQIEERVANATLSPSRFQSRFLLHMIGVPFDRQSRELFWL